MKTAYAQWGTRIAPVFDTAQQLQIIETAADRVILREQVAFPQAHLLHKVLRLVELGVDTLVCGAVSKPLHDLIAAYGIQVIPFVTGDLNAVIQAWLRGNFSLEMYAMPGCLGHVRQRFRGGKRRSRTIPFDNETNTRQ